MLLPAHYTESRFLLTFCEWIADMHFALWLLKNSVYSSFVITTTESWRLENIFKIIKSSLPPSTTMVFTTKPHPQVPHPHIQEWWLPHFPGQPKHLFHEDFSPPPHYLNFLWPNLRPFPLVATASRCCSEKSCDQTPPTQWWQEKCLDTMIWEMEELIQFLKSSLWLHICISKLGILISSASQLPCLHKLERSFRGFIKHQVVLLLRAGELQHQAGYLGLVLVLKRISPKVPKFLLMVSSFTPPLPDPALDLNCCFTLLMFCLYLL